MFLSHFQVLCKISGKINFHLSLLAKQLSPICSSKFFLMGCLMLMINHCSKWNIAKPLKFESVHSLNTMHQHHFIQILCTSSSHRPLLFRIAIIEFQLIPSHRDNITKGDGELSFGRSIKQFQTLNRLRS